MTPSKVLYKIMNSLTLFLYSQILELCIIILLILILKPNHYKHTLAIIKQQGK